MSPHDGLNATFASSMARPGHLGFISQSGALCTAILDWSQREMVGFSAFVSVGSMLDVGWGDLIQYLGRRSANPQHRDLHGIGRGCACVSFRGARGRAIETDHRDQAGPNGGCREGRRLAHRSADRPGRRSRRGFSPLRRGSSQHNRRTVLSLRGSGQAAAAEGAEPDDRHECRRTRRSCHRRVACPTAVGWPSFLRPPSSN